MIEIITYKLTTQRDVKVVGVNWRRKGTTCESKSFLGATWEQPELYVYQVFPHNSYTLFLALFFPTKGSNLFFFFSLQKSSLFVSPHLNFKAPVAKVVYVEN